MIKTELQEIVDREGAKGNNGLYLRNLLKEYLQVYVLFFIYTTDEYRENLIFTGGTCLRHFYDLPRLSEDLDFNFLKRLNSNELAEEIADFFEQEYQYKELRVSVKQKGGQILLRFPVLRDLNLASDQESDWLYVKIDLSLNLSSNFRTLMSSKALYDFNFIANHYDLPTLMAGKITAIFSREIFKGKKDRATVKGRDYFDLLWFLKKGVKPNLARIQDLLDLPGMDMKDLEQKLDRKVEELEEKFMTDFKNDLVPLIKNPAFVDGYLENYPREYKRAKESVFQNHSE